MNEENHRSWSWQSPKAVITLIAIVLVIGVVVVSLLRDRLVSQQYRQVTVVGQGKVTYQPDIAWVTLGVQIDKVAKPDAALNQLNAKVDGILKAVKAVGVSDDDIQTQNYSLSPQYDYLNNVNTVTGYSANEQVAVKVTGYDQDPGKLSRVIATVSQAGANQISNLSFDASNMNDLKQQARVLAILDARAKSVDLAKAAGVKLHDIVGWYENFISPVLSYDYSAKGGVGGGAVASPSTPSGLEEVIIEIGVNYNVR